MMDDNKLYSINELILWLEHPSQQWSGNRPLMYAKYARAELAQLQAIATAARPFAHPDLCKRLPNNGTSSDDQAVIFVRNNAVITLADCKKLAAALAALEQETKK